MPFVMWRTPVRSQIDFANEFLLSSKVQNASKWGLDVKKTAYCGKKNHHNWITMTECL